MESKGAGTFVPPTTRVYQDFEPSMEWVPEDDSDTLLVYLPGFAKEQLRVQLRSRNLIISGERKLQQTTWSRFRVEFPVSGNCDLNKISAKFEGNILFVRQPKLITPAAKPEEAKPAAVVPPVGQETADVNPAPTVPSNVEKKQVGEDEGVSNPNNGVEENVEKNAACTEGVCENASKKKTSEWEVDKYKQAAGALAMKLKTWRTGVNTVVIVMIAVVIGIFVSNSIKTWTKA